MQGELPRIGVTRHVGLAHHPDYLSARSPCRRHNYVQSPLGCRDTLRERQTFTVNFVSQSPPHDTTAGSGGPSTPDMVAPSRASAAHFDIDCLPPYQDESVQQLAQALTRSSAVEALTGSHSSTLWRPGSA